MYLLYSTLLTLGFVALLPRFLVDALRHGKYVAGFRERLGQLPQIETGARPVIWLHCVSVGETQAARPLVRALKENFPSHRLCVSTVTATGQQIARELFGKEATVFYFPFDWSWTVRRALKIVNPSAVLIMETELWPNFLRECRLQSIPAVLVNGRISEKSFRRYKLIRPFIKRIACDLSLAIMQTERDAKRLLKLGIAQERLTVSGNLKFDAETNASETQLTEILRARFSFDGGHPLIVAASTHAPEEQIILEAFKHLRENSKDVRLLIAPRHPERFAEIAALLDASGLSWTKRSSAALDEDRVCDVVLLDTVGELRAVYTLAAIVFVGGSLIPFGGHNILEPAAAGACIITGAHTSNFAAIVQAFRETRALVEVPPLSEKESPRALANRFKELLEDESLRREMAARARKLLEENSGATERTIKLVAPLLTSAEKLPLSKASAELSV